MWGFFQCVCVCVCVRVRARVCVTKTMEKVITLGDKFEFQEENLNF